MYHYYNIILPDNDWIVRKCNYLTRNHFLFTQNCFFLSILSRGHQSIIFPARSNVSNIWAGGNTVWKQITVNRGKTRIKIDEKQVQGFEKKNWSSKVFIWYYSAYQKNKSTPAYLALPHRVRKDVAKKNWFENQNTD